jgi:hypothetical protein
MMNRTLYATAFVAALAALAWVGAGYATTNPWALAMTALIGAFFVMGALELRRFRQATASLSHALVPLREPPEALAPWLDRIDPSLQNAVRQRIDGERAALPGPALTPYLAGLLVLLGMLGTFLGMVVTLQGTALALNASVDVETIRGALSAPVKGLGLAFGTSVAGVAASAMLGLMSALCRRERLQVSQGLDAKIAGPLRVHSHAHRRDEAFHLLQRQADTMPALVDGLQALMATIERQAQALNDRLVAGQATFHDKAEASYAALAASVDRSMKQSLAESARTAGAAIPPLVERAMADIASQTKALHESVSHTAQRQLDAQFTRFEAGTHAVAETWKSALDEQQRGSDRLLQALDGALGRFAETFEQRSASLLSSVQSAQSAAQDAMAAREQQRLAAWTQALEAMAASLQREWQQAGAEGIARQQQVSQLLAQTARDIGTQAEAQARSTIAEVARLVETASEAPRAAADVIAQLRQHLSDAMARDNTVIEERARILQSLATLLDTMKHEASQMAGAAAQVTAGAVEVSSVGEAFGHALRLFGDASDRLTAQLAGIEGALDKSLARSDDQLAYYVGQAREIVELSVVSQKQILDELQQVAAQRAAAEA